MKEIVLDGYRFIECCEHPRILVSIKGQKNFCNLSAIKKEALLRKEFNIASYTDFTQVHGANIFGLDNTELECDGFISSQAGYVYGIKTADCLPIIFWNQRQELSGLHCGWRGIARGIIDKLITSERGQSLQYAFFGPSIGKKFFEVKDDLIEEFKLNSMDISAFIEQRDTKKFFDMRAYCHDKITGYGIKILELKDSCSFQNEKVFFSWRRDKEKSLRNICLAWF